MTQQQRGQMEDSRCRGISKCVLLTSSRYLRMEVIIYWQKSTIFFNIDVSGESAHNDVNDDDDDLYRMQICLLRKIFFNGGFMIYNDFWLVSMVFRGSFMVFRVFLHFVAFIGL